MVATKARRLTDETFVAAARAVAERLTQAELRYSLRYRKLSGQQRRRWDRSIGTESGKRAKRTRGVRQSRSDDHAKVDGGISVCPTSFTSASVTKLTWTRTVV